MNQHSAADPLLDLHAASRRHMTTSVLTALPLDPRGRPEDHVTHQDAALALLDSLRPDDPVQHMLAAEAASAHFAAMECLRSAAETGLAKPAGQRLMRMGQTLSRMSFAAQDRLRREQGLLPEPRRRSGRVRAGDAALSAGQDPIPGRAVSAAPVEPDWDGNAVLRSVNPSAGEAIRWADPVSGEASHRLDLGWDPAAASHAGTAASIRHQNSMSHDSDAMAPTDTDTDAAWPATPPVSGWAPEIPDAQPATLPVGHPWDEATPSRSAPAVRRQNPMASNNANPNDPAATLPQAGSESSRKPADTARPAAPASFDPVIWRADYSNLSTEELLDVTDRMVSNFEHDPLLTETLEEHLHEHM